MIAFISIDAAEITRRLVTVGAQIKRQSGSHQIWTLNDAKTVVPVHPGDISTGTWRAIERQMADAVGRPDWLRISREEWKRHVKGQR